MKITVTLGNGTLKNSASISLDLPESLARREFYKASKSITEALGCFNIDREKEESTKSKEISQRTLDINVPVVNKQESEEFIEKSINEDAKKIKKEEPVKEEYTFKSVPKEGYISKKLVMAKCPKCDHIATPVLSIRNGELVYKDSEITCKKCQESIPIGEIKKAKYTCPNCETPASFYVMNDLKEVKCKNCESPIDLKWHDKKDMYLSSNLL